MILDAVANVVGSSAEVNEFTGCEAVSDHVNMRISRDKLTVQAVIRSAARSSNDTVAFYELLIPLRVDNLNSFCCDFLRSGAGHGDHTQSGHLNDDGILHHLMAEEPKLFRSALRYDKQNSLTDHIMQLARDFFTDNMKKKLGVDTLPEDVAYAIEFYCGGAKQIWYTWLFGGMTETPEQVLEIIIRHMPVILLPCVNS